MILGLRPANRGTTDPAKAGFLTGGAIAAQIGAQRALSSASGAVNTPAPTLAPPATSGAPLRGFAELFYFRVWPLPAVLDVQSPRVGQPIPFRLWNAYLQDNELQAIIETETTGVGIDIAPGVVIPALGLRTIVAELDETAPIQINAVFDFDFALGRALVVLLATLADIIPLEPESTIVETLEWNTNVIRNRDGSEQRIALRQRPRRSLRISLLLLDDAERKQLYDKFYRTAALPVIVPAYQYQSRLKAKTVIGDNRIYTNTRRADLRVGEDVLIRTRAGETFLFEIETVAADHVVVTTAFSQELPAGSVVCGAFSGRYQGRPILSMSSRSGKAEISVLLETPRATVAWPDHAPTIPTLGGKPLLLRRPLANGQADEIFDAGVEVTDNETGLPVYYSPFSQPFLEGSRSYLVQSLLDQDDLEFWRAFLDTIKGQQKTFYTPTYREDLVWRSSEPLLLSEIVVEGSSYASQYAESPAYRQLEIETSVGTFQVPVNAVENLGDATRIFFASPIPGDVTGAVVTRVSYVLLVRLASDVVTLTHQPTHTTVDLSLRMAVQ